MDNTSFIDSLYIQMKNNNNLAGTFEKIGNGTIMWHLFDGFTVTICQEYIGFDRKLFGFVQDSFTHWHPEDNEIYDDICDIGTKGNVTVIHKSFLGESILYHGPKDNCKYKRKWLFGRYYYFYAE